MGRNLLSDNTIIERPGIIDTWEYPRRQSAGDEYQSMHIPESREIYLSICAPTIKGDNWVIYRVHGTMHSADAVMSVAC